MRLDKIEEKLYRESSTLPERAHEFDPLDPRNVSRREEPEKATPKREIYQDWKGAAETTLKQKRYIVKGLIAIAALIVSLAAAYFVFILWNLRFSAKNILLSFDVEQPVEEGKDFSFRFLYHNNNRVDLRDCKLTLVFPDTFEIGESDKTPVSANKDFMAFDMGTLKSKQNGVINLKGRITEKEKSIIYLKGILSYKRGNDDTEYTKEVQQGVNIMSSTIDVALTATRQAAPGDLIEYKMIIRNTSEENVNGLEIHATYPDGFQFSNASVAPSADKNIFKFPTLIAYGKTELTIRGTITGSSGEKKSVIVEAGYYLGDKFNVMRRESAQTEIVTSPLIITQDVYRGIDEQAKSADAGSTVGVTINYRNSSTLPLRDVIITVDVASRAVDYRTVTSENGHFDFNQKRMSWHAADVPELALLKPQASGTLKYEFQLLNMLPSDRIEDKNFEITLTASIDSPDVPTPIGKNKIISSNKLSIKVNSKVLFGVYAYYNDNTIENDGPIPPRVGEETTYTIHWKLINVNNDLNNVVVKAGLPGNATWTGKYMPTASKQITYNERTKEVVWNLGFVSALTGTHLSAQEAVFQVAITPQDNQVGQEPGLLSESVLTGTDSFTGKPVFLKAPQITTGLNRDDPGIGFGQGIVIK